MHDCDKPEPHRPRPSRLLELLGCLAEGNDVDPDELERAVCQYTTSLRASGVLPERVLIAVKTLAEGAGLPPTDSGRDQLSVQQLAQWCIKEYYRTE